MNKLILILLVLCIAELAFFLSEENKVEHVVPELKFNYLDRQNSQKLKWIYADAVKQWRESGSASALNKTADILLCYGYHVEAATLYRGLLLADPNLTRAWLALAMCLDSLGSHQDAYRCYQHALQLDLGPQEVKESRHRCGELLLIMGRADQAVQTFTENSDHAPSSFRLVRCLLHQDKFDRAQQVYNRLMTHAEANQAIEMVILNDVAMRLFNKTLAELPFHKRSSLWSYQPVDIFKRNIESYYDMSMMELFTPALEEMPQMVQHGLEQQHIDFWGLSEDPARIKRGQEIFEKHNCAICHGHDAYGNTAPNLRDDFWLGGGRPDRIHNSITYGRKNGTMPGHQFVLRPDQIVDVTLYIMQLNLQTEKQMGKTPVGKGPEGWSDPTPSYQP